MVSVSTEAYNPVQGYMFLVSIKAQMKWSRIKYNVLISFSTQQTIFGSTKIQTLARVRD